MANLRIKIENFRAISNAEIELSDLTVLAGVNASGKSTIARLFHDVVETNRSYDIFGRQIAFFRAFMTHLDALFTFLKDANFKTQKVKKALEAIVSTQTDVESFDIGVESFRDALNILLAEAKKNGQKIEKRVWDAFCRAVANDALIARTIDSHDILEHFEKWLTTRFAFFDEDCKNFFSESRDSLPFLLRAGLVDEFANLEKYNNTLRISIVDGTNKIFEIPKTDTSFPSIYSPKRALYIENPSKTLPSIKGNKLILNNVAYILPETNKQMGQLIYSSKDEIDYGFIGGRFEAPQNQDTFSGRDWDYLQADGHRFKLSECAEGIKSLAAIPILDNYGLLDSNTLLIIDEPEVHLHPQWIVKCAEVLVELIKKRRVRILVTSHSPYLVQALQQKAFRELEKEQWCFYLAEKDTDFAYKYTRLGENIAPIFKTFNVALDEIAMLSE